MEQQSAERTFGEPEQEHSGQPEQQPGVSRCHQPRLKADALDGTECSPVLSGDCMMGKIQTELSSAGSKRERSRQFFHPNQKDVKPTLAAFVLPQ